MCTWVTSLTPVPSACVSESALHGWPGLDVSAPSELTAALSLRPVPRASTLRTHRSPLSGTLEGPRRFPALLFVQFRPVWCSDCQVQPAALQLPARPRSASSPCSVCPPHLCGPQLPLGSGAQLLFSLVSDHILLCVGRHLLCVFSVF